MLKQSWLYGWDFIGVASHVTRDSLSANLLILSDSYNLSVSLSLSHIVCWAIGTNFCRWTHQDWWHNFTFWLTTIFCYSFNLFSRDISLMRKKNHLSLWVWRPTFVWGKTQISNRFPLHIDSHLDHHHLLKKLTFLQCVFFVSSSKISNKLGRYIQVID